MTRAAVYARFSSDLQSDRSIDDQVALCCDYAAAKGYQVARVYSDAAASGASLHGRPGILRMLADAETKAFDVLIVESTSRIGRDQEDRARLRKELRFFDVRIETPAEGVVTPIVDGVRAVLDAEYLEELKKHTRRGMRGRIASGLSAGGLTYGYAGGAEKGKRVIVDHEAAIVRRIFADYDRGISPRAIAEELNKAQVRPPRGSDWRASTLIGNRDRGSGILNNALYDGRLVWNRVTMRKDPRTGKRVSRVNPESDWITHPAPGLRIVEAELFARVQAAIARRAKVRPEHSKRPRHMLAGLLRCGCCGGAMAVNNVNRDARRIACGRRKEGGRCDNGKTYPLAPIEQRVVEALRAQLADPRGIEHYLKAYQAERKRLAKASAGKRAAAERSLVQAERAIERIVAAIAAGTIGDTEARAQLEPLRQRRDGAASDLAQLSAPPVTTLHPAAVRTYLAAVEELASTLSRRTVEGHEKVADALRALVAAVKVSPGKGSEPVIEVSGQLSAIVGGGLFPESRLVPPALVAGARYVRSRSPETGIYAFAA